MASEEFAAVAAMIRDSASRSGTSGDRFDVAALRAPAQSSPWPIPDGCTTR